VGRVRWAIIVGISKYEKEVLNLKYADRDAEELYQLIQMPSGGGFEADHIKKLINEEATMANVARALRSFMKKPAQDDIVLIYFACHGAPDPDKPNNVYLLTYDTDPDDIAGTAIPMREISLSLQDNLLAKRVVIVADTCHSAAIGGGVGRRSANSTAVVNRYLQHLSESQEGIALLTSAEANEVSLEDEKWGGGHGVFTYYLLEGMKGEADSQPRDGIVTVGELFEYVRVNVQKATGNQQHPSIGTGKYDRRLPMAITGGISAEEHYQLGCQFFKMGWILNDRWLFESAKRQFDEALRLSPSVGTTLPEVYLQRGLTLSALGKHSEAIQTFKGAIKQDKAGVLTDASLHLGIAHAKMGNYKDAVSAFEECLKRERQLENVRWVKEYVNWLGDPQIDNKCALLIGIGDYADDYIRNLEGPKNDIRLMIETLIHKFEFQASNIVILLNNYATRQGILDALHGLINRAAQCDTVVIYYSGHSRGGDSDTYLFVHDSSVSEQQTSMAISAEELHNLIHAIPIRHKTVILDTHTNSKFLDLVEQEANYALFMASRLGEQTYERDAEWNGKSMPTGVFTYAFVQQLSESNPKEVTYDQIASTIVSKLRSYRSEQTPFFIGMRELRLFSGIDDYLGAFDFSQRRNYSSLTLQEVKQKYTRYQRLITQPFPQLYYSFGRAFIEKGSYAEAIEALQTALLQSEKDDPDATLALTFAQVGGQQYLEASANFQTYISLAQPSLLAIQIQEQVERLVQGRKHALLVGIDTYSNPLVTDVRGAANDVRALKDILHNRCGFQEENITVLLDQQATCQAIKDAFKQLLENARDEPALFYFAGNGSSTDESPTIVSADGRQPEVFDIELEELAALASRAGLLVTIIDAGWTLSSNSLVDSRTIPGDARSKPGTRDVAASRDISKFSLQIGGVSFYNRSIETGFISGAAAPLESEFPKTQISTKKMFHGHLTHALIESLSEADPGSLTCAQLIRLLSDKIGKPVVLGENLDQIIFTILEHTIVELFIEFDRQFINQSIQILRRLIEREGDVYPEGYLNLGIAYALRGEHAKSIEALKKAILQQGDNNYPEAHYHLGRVLFESKRNWAEAVSALKRAIEQEPDNAAAYYYLGQAIRSLVEQETLVHAERDLRTYLEKGAPLGHEDEVEEFLASRRSGTR